jgi:hypothetical protein
VSWRYRVTSAGDLEGGRSGGLYAKADVAQARWFNFLWTSQKWADLSESARAAVNAQYHLDRGDGDPPQDGSGRWVTDRTYGSGGVALRREEFRPWS